MNLGEICSRIPTPITDRHAWWTTHRSCVGEADDSVTRAVVASVRFDRLAWVFASSYQEAVRSLFGPGPGVAVFAASEAGGVHPRAIETRYDPRAGRVRGTKTFVTHGDLAEELFVVASRGRDGERNQLVVIRISNTSAGLAVYPLPELPFVPEISHARIDLDAEVSADAVLPGDGYRDYLKPFRTVEDIHVFAGICAWLAGICMRSGQTKPFIELEALVAELVELGSRNPGDFGTHIAVHDAIERARRSIDAVDWRSSSDAVAQSWARDRALLNVATKAREARYEAAKRALAQRA